MTGSRDDSISSLEDLSGEEFAETARAALRAMEVDYGQIRDCRPLMFGNPNTVINQTVLSSELSAMILSVLQSASGRGSDNK